MRIYHNNKCIANNAIQAGTPLKRAMGLMFKRKPIPLIFNLPETTIQDVHMLFVFFNIDVLFLDSDNIVTKKPTLKSWAGRMKGSAKTIIELPEGTIKEHQIEVGDVINIVNPK